MELHEVRADVFRQLSRGVADRRSPYRNPAFGTVGRDGQPQIRTVVLRAFDPQALVLTIHSDVRAAKIRELQADPRVAIHVWDDGAQVQVRLDGTASVLTGTDARPDWDRLHSGSRATYAVRPRPAAPLADPAAADADRLDEAEAFANFAAIPVRLAGLDWLHLGRDGHRRAVFRFGEGEAAHWVVP